MIELKIGREKYQITESDVFLDNGSSIQILTQTHTRRGVGEKAAYVRLTKKAIKEIQNFERKQREHAMGERYELFNLIGV